MTFVRTKADDWPGTPASPVLKTLERQGRLHRYGIAPLIEQTNDNLHSLK